MTNDNGLTRVASRYSISETVERMQAAFAEKGLKVFNILDHSGEAEKVGLKMRPDEGADLRQPEGGNSADDCGS